MIKLKAKEEIAILREGGRRLAIILDELCKAVKPGVTSLDLEMLARDLIARQGDKPSFLGYTPQGSGRPYPAAICVSINDEIIHGIPNEKVKSLQKGDIVGIDLGLIHQGLFTDAARTLIVGEASDLSKKLVETAEEALRRGISAARYDDHIGDIGFAIQGFVGRTPFSIARDLCGHGVGYAVHEDPYVPNEGRKGEGPALKEGLVIAIEPMINEGVVETKLDADGYTYRTRDGKRSAHFEHTIAITKKETIVLTAL